MDLFHKVALLSGGCLVVYACWLSIHARWRGTKLRIGLTIDPRWRPLVQDERLLEALAILHAHAPIMRPYIKKMRKRDVRIVVEPKNDEYAGQYRHYRREIAITEPIVREPMTVLAAVLAHELGHIRKNHHGSIYTQADVREWVEDELASHTLEAIVWESIRTGRERTDWASKLNRQLAAYRRGELVGFITTITGYQKTFFGRELQAKGVRM